jgi:chemotaxis protein CheZ
MNGPGLWLTGRFFAASVHLSAGAPAVNAVLSCRILVSLSVIPVFGKDHAQKAYWSNQEMAAPRKVFRIEEAAAARLARPRGGSPDSLPHGELMQALAALRGVMSAAPSRTTKSDAKKTDNVARGESQWLGVEAEHLTRIAHELNAVTTGTGQATQKILYAAEAIDQLANTLAAALKSRIEQDLARDISDHIVKIFEACNFQDLIGQRIAKVMATLKVIEEHVARAIEEIKKAPPARAAADATAYLHGPRLDYDRGHVSQNEIDAMFGG